MNFCLDCGVVCGQGRCFCVLQEYVLGLLNKAYEWNLDGTWLNNL